MISLLQEILSTIRRNKMRTFLTGFAVAWGIFMLIVLLGAGNGLKNGFTSNWGDELVNVVMVFGGRTNVPYAGLPSKRQIVLYNQDVDFAETEFSGEVGFATARTNLGSKNISFGAEYINSSVYGATADIMMINGLKLDEGRFINYPDLKEKRKTTVLSKKAVEILFKGAQAIGKHVNIDGNMYLVTGIYHVENRQDQTTAYIPLTTSQAIYSMGHRVSNMAFTLSEKIDNLEGSNDFIHRYKNRVGQFKQISPNDNGALWYWNRFENYLQMAGVSRFINIAVWIIGIFTLLSGIVGVSNIMLVTVRERTREFGIRKAIGASPASILRLVVIESIIITTIFGYIGLVCGVGITELMSGMFGKSAGSAGISMNVFVNPTVDLNVAIQATVLLIVAGTMAGFFPALKAVRIKTITALNSK
ncbi:MAG: ABC transporter permease [Prevotellaceae bacterium]|jgi:putative ABC transport system permease protein|nr:ABC transporter permease [Prevotellaceae bacterium]